MLERSEKALRLVCIALAAVLLLELGLKLFSRNPLSGLKIPALPTVTAEAESGNGVKGSTNSAGKGPATVTAGKATNSLASANTNGLGTNLLAKTSPTQEVHLAHHSSNRRGDTNSVAGPRGPLRDTDAVASHTQGTNALAESEGAASHSNTLARADSGSSGTNSPHAKSSAKDTNTNAHVELAMNGPNPSARPGMGKPGPNLPLPIQARVDRVVDSELFGPVFHPMPAALVGIAGNLAFLRAPTGQTGAVKEGDELGGLKLLRIGVNRVLVEEDGQKKELMIFQGLGGQSLLPN